MTEARDNLQTRVDQLEMDNRPVIIASRRAKKSHLGSCSSTLRRTSRIHELGFEMALTISHGDVNVRYILIQQQANMHAKTIYGKDSNRTFIEQGPEQHKPADIPSVLMGAI